MFTIELVIHKQVKLSTDYIASIFTSDKAGKIDYEPLKCHKAVFLSMHGGGRKVDPESGELLNIGIILCYIMPIKQRGMGFIAIEPFCSNEDILVLYSFLQLCPNY